MGMVVLFLIENNLLLIVMLQSQHKAGSRDWSTKVNKQRLHFPKWPLQDLKILPSFGLWTQYLLHQQIGFLALWFEVKLPVVSPNHKDYGWVREKNVKATTTKGCGASGLCGRNGFSSKGPSGSEVPNHQQGTHGLEGVSKWWLARGITRGLVDEVEKEVAHNVVVFSKLHFIGRF